ncbi:hypothetical protein EIP86_000517 [Pleurotus ostreatoroseus]|nr:hypothetical protein EIP86_000517 [Pleurotus ostreatoroseus]
MVRYVNVRDRYYQREYHHFGFGPRMNDTPLVIMWPNEDGSVTLSQRQASGHTAPVPVASPPHTATVSSLTDLSDEISPILAFDIPQDAHDDGDGTMIWAFGVTRPDPPADADLVQHQDAGTFVLEARKHGDDGDSDDAPSSPMPSTSSHPTSSSLALALSSSGAAVSSSSAPPGLSATSPAPPILYCKLIAITFRYKLIVISVTDATTGLYI